MHNTLIGKRFGKLTVLEQTKIVYKCGAKINGYTCQCDCGNLTKQQIHALTSGRAKSCGCIAQERKIPKIIGNRYGKLLVIGRRKNKNNKWSYLCICDCGRRTYQQKYDLQAKKVKSCGCQQGHPNEKSAFNAVICHYKCNAKKRNLKFKLTEQELAILFQQNCFYCGTKPTNLQKHKNSRSQYTYNGIDRVDSYKGYTKTNCVPCCKTCNRMKLKLSKKEFLNHIKQIYMHSIDKQQNS